MSALSPKGKPGEPVVCLDCGHEFPQDPPFAVACPTCAVPAGQYCRRPSDHQGPFVAFHATRDLEALRQGYYDHDCSTRKQQQHSPKREPSPKRVQLTLSLVDSVS